PILIEGSSQNGKLRRGIHHQSGRFRSRIEGSMTGQPDFLDDLLAIKAELNPAISFGYSKSSSNAPWLLLYIGEAAAARACPTLPGVLLHVPSPLCTIMPFST